MHLRPSSSSQVNQGLGFSIIFQSPLKLARKMVIYAARVGQLFGIGHFWFSVLLVFAFVCGFGSNRPSRITPSHPPLNFLLLLQTENVIFTSIDSGDEPACSFPENCAAWTHTSSRNKHGSHTRTSPTPALHAFKHHLPRATNSSTRSCKGSSLSPTRTEHEHEQTTTPPTFAFALLSKQISLSLYCFSIPISLSVSVSNSYLGQILFLLSSSPSPS